jgi:hypothetical protein
MLVIREEKPWNEEEESLTHSRKYLLLRAFCCGFMW